MWSYDFCWLVVDFADVPEGLAYTQVESGWFCWLDSGVMWCVPDDDGGAYEYSHGH
jgi:hypothetical protein